MRELAQELGFRPATTNPEAIERHRRLNKALDAAPDLEKTAKKFAHLHMHADEWSGTLTAFAPLPVALRLKPAGTWRHS